MYQGWCIIYFPTSEKWLQGGGGHKFEIVPAGGCTTGWEAWWMEMRWRLCRGGAA